MKRTAKVRIPYVLWHEQEIEIDSDDYPVVPGRDPDEVMRERLIWAAKEKSEAVIHGSIRVHRSGRIFGARISVKGMLRVERSDKDIEVTR